MKNFKSDYRSRERRDFSRRDFGGRDSKRLSLFDAVCDECGRDCQVPFKPSGEKPVYCSDCFDKKRNQSGDSRQSDRRDYPRPRFEERRSFPPAVDTVKSTGSQLNGQILEQLRSLNSKLDKIISVLEPKTAVPQVSETKAKKPKASKKKAIKPTSKSN